MSGTILLRGAKQLLTLQGPAEPRRGATLQELSIIRDGALLIEDGRIAEVGLTRRVENLVGARECQEIDASGRVVMPGFVDCHAHLVGGVLSPDVRIISGKRLEFLVQQYVDGMLRHGTTYLESRAGFGPDLRSSLKALKVTSKLDGAPVDIASTFLPLASNGDESGADPRYLAWVCSTLLPAIRLKTQAVFASINAGGTAAAADCARQCIAAARDLRFQIKIEATADAGQEAISLALESGAISVDHLGDAVPNVTDSLARSNTMAVLLPGAAFLQSQRTSARRFIDEGAAVALGTNFTPGAGPTFSMPAIIALACTYLEMTPQEAIHAATYNAACALRAERVAGSLETGKPADLIMLNVSDYREITSYFGVNLVHRTMKHGVTVYEEGKVAHCI